MVAPLENVAVTHHWMFNMRGGEKVLEHLCDLAPDASIYCLAYEHENLSGEINRRKIHASFLQRWKFLRRLYKQLLPLHPFLIRRMRIPSGTETVLCSDASMIKGIPVPKECTLVCYCHSPPRYVWDLCDEYSVTGGASRHFQSAVLRAVIPWCRRFDRRAAQRVDLFIANSKFVADRIRQHYGREAEVVYPPVEVNAFDHTGQRRDFYLCVSELTAYKRIDLAVEAFKRSGDSLVIIGDGPERASLESRASDNIRFLGRQDFLVLKEHYERCRAFIFPGIEDFGITAVEAQAAGAPVLAYGIGGACETVVDGVTGHHFKDHSVNGLMSALPEIAKLYEGNSAIAETCRQNAMKFSGADFGSRILSVVHNVNKLKAC